MSKQTANLEVTKSRNNNPKLLTIAEAFKPATSPYEGSTCANIKTQCGVDLDVAAPYVLARLCAMFQGLNVITSGQEGYKVTWEVEIRHKATGHVVTFYDYKGGISYGSDVYGKAAPKAFIDDVRKLLKALGDDRFPHPYDGCVVGEEA